MKPWIVVLALALPSASAEAAEHSYWWQMRAQVACIADVTRLCSSAMPNPSRVEDCMKDKKDKVSERCAEFYPGGKNAE